MKAIIITLLIAVASASSVRLLPQFQANYHYENPFGATHKPHCSGSREGTRAMQYDGLDNYYACMPENFTDARKDNECYQDAPIGNMATPMAVFYDTEKNKDGETITRCALVCSGMATGACAPGAECMILPGQAEMQVGVCMYKNPAA